MGKTNKQMLTMTGACAWRATVYNHYAELEPLWRRMEGEGHCTVFQTYDWAACWYDAAIACSEVQPVIVVLEKEKDNPIWILPLCLYRKKKLRIISFADLGFSDYAAPVMARGAPSDRDTIEAMFNAIINALPPCDVINFQKLPEKIGDIPNPLLSLRGLERFPSSCHGIDIREPWFAVQKKIVTSHMRSNIRRAKKLIEKQGEVTVEFYESPETLKPALATLMALRQIRFKALGLPEMPPLGQNFYQNLISREDQGFKVRITTLMVSGEAVATCLGIIRNNTFHSLLLTFEMEKWHRFSPGILLCDAVLTRFAKDVQNNGYYDFSVGDNDYKKRFGSQTYPLYEWMAPKSVKGRGFYAAWRAKITLRRYPRLYATLKQIAGRRVAGGFFATM